MALATASLAEEQRKAVPSRRGQSRIASRRKPIERGIAIDDCAQIRRERLRDELERWLGVESYAESGAIARFRERENTISRGSQFRRIQDGPQRQIFEAAPAPLQRKNAPPTPAQQ